MNQQKTKVDFDYKLWEKKFGGKSVLLHSCCAPCAAELMVSLKKASINLTVLFYNPNIHPLREYNIRKEENKRFSDKLNIPFVDLDYDKSKWFELTTGLEDEPERGIRCTVCFDLRLLRTAKYAFENNIKIITSSLGISRWKNMNQITKCGLKSASYYPGVIYWTYNWRKKGGSARMISISKKEEFYQQQYCGCVYSLRDTNKHRIKNGRKKIKIGTNYYG